MRRLSLSLCAAALSLCCTVATPALAEPLELGAGVTLELPRSASLPTVTAHLPGPALQQLPAIAAAQTASTDLKSALLSGFVQYVLPVLFTGLATLLGWVFVQLGKRYGTEAGTAKKNQVLGHIFALAQTVVADLEATLKPQLLAASADGVLTKLEIAQLRDAALQRLKALAGEKGLEEVQFVLGIAAPELEAFLMGLIERAVDNQPSKKSGPSPAASLNQALAAAAASGSPR